jgi:transposase
MSKHSARAGDVSGLLAQFAQRQEKAQARTGQMFPIITIQEAGLIVHTQSTKPLTLAI